MTESTQDTEPRTEDRRKEQHEYPELSFWQGSSSKVWRPLVMLLIGMIAFFGKDIYLDVKDLRENIPKTYAEKIEVTNLGTKMDDGFKEIRNDIESVNGGISEINRYLRGSGPILSSDNP